jgi:hypothetical protein
MNDVAIPRINRFRPRNWEAIYFDFMRAADQLEFIWGRADCCLWGADWVRLMRGVDPAAEFRFVYNSLGGALRVLKPYGGVLQIAEEMFRRINLQPIPPRMAQRGDIAVMTSDDLVRLVDGTRGMEFVGVVTGMHVACLGPKGRANVPLSNAVMCWAV